MTKLVKMNLDTFLDELASSSPAPGGGSVAALSGALAAALSSMVCNLTIGKQGYEDKQQLIHQIMQQSEDLRSNLTVLVDKDTDAFNEVMKALKMPKETEQQKTQRRAAMQTAFQHAAEIPLETARRCVQLLDVARLVAENGNKNSITDAAVSALMAQAGVQAAILNVRINLQSIKETTYVDNITVEVQQLQKKATEKTMEILTIVEQSF